MKRARARASGATTVAIVILLNDTCTRKTRASRRPADAFVGVIRISDDDDGNDDGGEKGRDQVPSGGR